MILFGVHPVAKMLENLPKKVEATDNKLLLLLARKNKRTIQLLNYAYELQIPVQDVSVSALTVYCGSHAHRGVALVDITSREWRSRKGNIPSLIDHLPPIDRGKYRNQKKVRATKNGSTDCCREYPETKSYNFLELFQQKSALIIVTDQVTDPVNLGSISRCADQFGADLVVISRRRSAQVTSTTMRVSAGAAAHVKTVVVPNIPALLEKLKNIGYWVYGADISGRELTSVEFPSHVVIVLGSEGSGLRALVRKRCDYLVGIPSMGKIDSLNVGVAGGVIMYEVRKQHHSAGII